MNMLFLDMIGNQFKQIANIPNLAVTPFGAVDVSRMRDDIQSVAKTVESEEPQISAQLMWARDTLFIQNNLGQAFINPIMLGEVIFGLDYVINKQQTQSNKPKVEDEKWQYIHPMIQKASKQLYLDGHYANAAEDAFIEINDRVKKLFMIVKPGCKVPDGGDAMNQVFSANNPLVSFCDQSTDTGINKQKGYMQMLAGAMSALRNPKAHSNNEKLSAEESYRRLATASMLMYAIDEAVVYSNIKE